MKRKTILLTSILNEIRFFLLLKNIVIIVSFLLVILSLKIKKKCLSYQEFQNKEEFEDTQGVINNTYVKYNMSYLRYFCLFM